MNSRSLSDYLVLSPNYSNKEMLDVTETAHAEGKKVVLFSVPDHKIRKKLLRYVSIAIFDEFQMGEISRVAISDLSSIKTAVLRLYGRGVETVVVKMNDGRALLFSEERFLLLEKNEKELLQYIKWGRF